MLFEFIVVEDQIVPTNNRAEVFAAGDALAARAVDHAPVWRVLTDGGGAVPYATAVQVVATRPQPESVEHIASCVDRRCRHWTKVVRAAAALLQPWLVDGADSLPGGYLRDGFDTEIEPGDYVLTGEQVHHAKQRGWAYTLRRMTRSSKTGAWGLYSVDYSGTKDALRALGGQKELLRGSGDIAAMVRHIHARRAGLV